MTEAAGNHFKEAAPVALSAERRKNDDGSSKLESIGGAPGFLGIIPSLEFPSRRCSVETFSEVSAAAAAAYSTDIENENERCGRHVVVLRNGSSSVRGCSNSPDPEAAAAAARGWNAAAQPATFWSMNKGLIFVVLAQAFGALMSLTTRLLETEGSHGASMHPFQILLMRMFLTLVFSLVYLSWAKIPHAPLGHRDVRGLLVARGIGGFFGVFGFYYSLQYLPIAEATVITFLAPTVACFACWILIHEPFTRSQQIAGLVSLLGVILIARPASLFPGSLSTPPNPEGADGSITVTNSTALINSDKQSGITLSQRFAAIGFALVGVCGAACAYTTLRWIGKRAHPLISMTYFAGWCMFVSAVAIVAIPSVGFRLPSNFQEWGYLALLGLSGFIMQFFLTAGLAHEKSSRATNMVYTQILFALAFDKLIFDTTPGGWSIVGSSLVLGSALYIAVHKVREKEKTSVDDIEAEELNLMAGSSDDENSNENNEIDTRSSRG